jgi:SAM-dependent methyltransferase
MRRARGRTLLSFVLRTANHVAARITRIGERHRLESLIYNPVTFLYYLGRSLADAPGVIDVIRTITPDARRYVDVGCGAGGFAATARRRGLEVDACEYSLFGRLFARLLGVRARRLDLSRNPPAAVAAGFDVAYCFEVAEHLRPEFGDRLVEFLSRVARLVIFTAAQPGQGGTGHVNEQPRRYWIDRFEAAGLRYEAHLTRHAAEGFRAACVAPWFGQNVLIFSAPTSETDLTP